MSGSAEFAEALEAIHLANHEAWRLLRSGDQPVATIHNLGLVEPAVHTANPHELTAAQDRALRFDETMWCWTRALRDGVLQVPGRAPIELEDLAGSFDLIGFSYYFAQTVYADEWVPYPADARMGPMGYAPWPEGLGLVMRRLADELPGRPWWWPSAASAPMTTSGGARCCVTRSNRSSSPSTTDSTCEGCSTGPGWTTTSGASATGCRSGQFDRDRNARPSADLARAWATGAPEPA